MGDELRAGPALAIEDLALRRKAGASNDLTAGQDVE
jgi:hypothetical protein